MAGARRQVEAAGSSTVMVTRIKGILCERGVRTGHYFTTGSEVGMIGRIFIRGKV